MRILDGNKIERYKGESVILIDVFRATSSIAVMLYKNVKEIIPFENEQFAREFYKNHNEYILVGERNGNKIPDFHYGNSPTELTNANIENKKIIFVTTNGTRILKKIDSPKIFFASFLNMDFILKHINENTDVVCANRIDLFSIEDFLCASYIKAKIKNIKIDFERIKKIIINSKSAERLRLLGYPQDIEFSLRLNEIPVVPILKDGKIIKLKKSEVLE